MTPEEKAVIQAAIEWRRAIPGRTRDVWQTIELEEKIWNLIIRCNECNAGGHVCPGDGNPIGHGDTDCGEHDDDEPRECNNCAPLRAGASVDRVDGSDLTTPCVECGAVETITVSQEGAELIWVPRTWADVRAGDTVRMPGTDSTARVVSAVHRAWHVHPAADEYRPNEMPANWSEVYVGLRPLDSEAPEDVPCTRYSMDPAGPIEIQATQAEVDAIEMLGGWPARVGITIE